MHLTVPTPEKDQTHPLYDEGCHSMLLPDPFLQCFGPINAGLIVDCNIGTLSGEFQTDKFTEATGATVSLSLYFELSKATSEKIRIRKK
jgi:hypothetical protein